MKREEQLKIMLACSILFFVIVMSPLFIYKDFGGEIVPREASAGSMDDVQSSGDGSGSGERRTVREEAAFEEGAEAVTFPLSLQLQAGEEGLKIPLPEGLGAETLTIENRYESEEIRIVLPGEGDPYGFFRDSVLTGSKDKIRDVSLSLQDGCACLRIRTNGVYEFRCHTKEGMAVLTLEKPDDLYDRIVILETLSPAEDIISGDAGGSAADFAGKVMETLQDRLEKEGIRTYCIDRKGVDLTEEEIAAFVNGLGADMLIGIGTGDAEESGELSVRILYNGTYVIPDFGNEQLAALLGRHIVNAEIVVRSVTEPEGEPLEKIQIPAAAVMSGGGFLPDDAGAELADEITEAVLEAYSAIRDD